MADVVVKRNVTVPHLLKRMIEYAWELIDEKVLLPMPHEDSRRKFLRDVANESKPYLDSEFMFQVSPTPPVDGVDASIGDVQHRLKHPTKDELWFANPNQLNSKPFYIRAMWFKGPYMDMLIRTQDINYLVKKLIIVAHQIIDMHRRGLSNRELAFIDTYWDGFVRGTVRHCIRHGSYDIPWHRDSDVYTFQNGSLEAQMFGSVERRGFITSGLYVHRPNGIRGAGISFRKGNNEVTLFPKGGTVVTFLDQNVFHKVVPVTCFTRLDVDARMGFIQRSTMFVSLTTNSEKLENISRNGLLNAVFHKAGLKAAFRDAMQVHSFLEDYFRQLENEVQNPNIDNFLRLANGGEINRAYNFKPNSYTTFATPYLAQMGITEPPPVADFFVYKIAKGNSNENARKKLQGLRNLYTELERSFGNVDSNDSSFVSNITSVISKRKPRHTKARGLKGSTVRPKGVQKKR